MGELGPWLEGLSVDLLNQKAAVGSAATLFTGWHSQLPPQTCIGCTVCYLGEDFDLSRHSLASCLLAPQMPTVFFIQEVLFKYLFCKSTTLKLWGTMGKNDILLFFLLLLNFWAPPLF